MFACLEVFAGEANWSVAHREAGLSTHPGVDNGGSRLRFYGHGF